MADAAAGGASPQSEGSEAGGEWTKVGAGGRPVKAAAPSGAHAPSPDESEERGRLAGGKTADAASRAANAPGGAGTGKRASPKRQEQSPVRTGLDEKLSAIGQQLERLLADQSKICQRLDSVESREAQHVAARSDFDEWRNGKSMHASTRDASGDSDSGYSSDRSDVTRSSLASFDSSGDGEGEKEYLVVQPTNPHWNAKSLSHDDQQEPHLYPLHGYQTYDDLRASRAGADGLLGKGMRYLMPIALYSKTGGTGCVTRSVSSISCSRASTATPTMRSRTCVTTSSRRTTRSSARTGSPIGAFTGAATVDGTLSYVNGVLNITYTHGGASHTAPITVAAAQGGLAAPPAAPISMPLDALRVGQPVIDLVRRCPAWVAYQSP